MRVIINTPVKDYTFGSGQAFTSVGLTAVDEVAYSIAVPPVINVNALIDIEALLTTSAVANTKNFKVWLSTTNETIGAVPSINATSIMLYNANGATSTSVGIYRQFSVTTLTSLYTGRAASSPASNDLSNLTNITSAVTIPSLANQLYFIVTVQRANSADTIRVQHAYMKVKNI